MARRVAISTWRLSMAEYMQLSAVGGLGVLLVSAMAQQVEYQRAADRNRISLVFGSA